MAGVKQESIPEGSNNGSLKGAAMQSMEEARMVNRGIADYEKGKVADGKSSLKKLREKYDI